MCECPLSLWLWAAEEEGLVEPASLPEPEPLLDEPEDPDELPLSELEPEPEPELDEPPLSELELDPDEPFSDDEPEPFDEPEPVADLLDELDPRESVL